MLTELFSVIRVHQCFKAPFKGAILNALFVLLLLQLIVFPYIVLLTRQWLFKKNAVSHINEILVSSAFHILLICNRLFHRKVISQNYLPLNGSFCSY